MASSLRASAIRITAHSEIAKDPVSRVARNVKSRSSGRLFAPSPAKSGRGVEAQFTLGALQAGSTPSKECEDRAEARDSTSGQNQHEHQ
jgi:hypothetical protein